MRGHRGRENARRAPEESSRGRSEAHRAPPNVGREIPRRAACAHRCSARRLAPRVMAGNTAGPAFTAEAHAARRGSSAGGRWGRERARPWGRVDSSGAHQVVAWAADRVRWAPLGMTDLGSIRQPAARALPRPAAVPLSSSKHLARGAGNEAGRALRPPVPDRPVPCRPGGLPGRKLLSEAGLSSVRRARVTRCAAPLFRKLSEAE